VNTGASDLGKGEILVVDDQPANLRILTTMLSNRGFQVRPAVGGELALQEVWKSPPDLILLDIMMPDIDGYEVCERLKADERTRDIPVIFLSAKGQTADKVRAFDVGGVDYVTKPFQVGEVVARVQTHIALRAMRRQLEEKNAFLRTVIDSLAYPFYVVDAEDYTIQIANLAVGLDVSEGMTCYTLTHGSSQPCGGDDHPCPIEAVKRTGKPAIVEHVHRGEDSVPRYIDVHAHPILDGAGNVVQVLEYNLDVTERKRAEEAEIIAEERRRIAQETHDGLVQSMAGLRFRVRQWHKLVDTDPAQMHAELDELRAVLDDNIRDMRRSIFALRPITLEEQGFFPALHKLAADYGAHYDTRVKVQVNGPEERLPLSLELALFRIIQEALHNVGKHAQADTAWVVLDLEAVDGITVSVRDDGRGFDPERLAQYARQGHLGLKQMRERVEKVDGTLTIWSEVGGGTEVRVVLPLAEAGAESAAASS
jgi:signal transduction histidine kinase